MKSHKIDYTIFMVKIELDSQEVVVAEAGSFMMMENGIKMETIFGDGSQQEGSLLGGLGRLLHGDNRF